MPVPSLRARSTVGALALAALLGACSSAPSAPGPAGAEIARRTQAVTEAERALDDRRIEVDRERAELAAREAELVRREARFGPGAGAAAGAPPVGRGVVGADLPPAAKAGECYARVYREPTYETASEQVVRRAQTSRVDIVPARYQKATERVQIKPESRQLQIVPAVYETVTERVMVTPATRKLTTVPAVTRQETAQVLVKAAHTAWKKGTGPIQKIDAATGEIMCLVEVPAVYDTITRTVEVTPASTRVIEVPATYKTVSREVLKTPATTREIVIPAEYRTIEVTREVSPAREVKITVPPEYQTVERRAMVSPGGLEWRAILCETNMTRERVKDIQTALLAAGHNPGPIDGVIAGQTMNAVNAYQRANKLPVDKYLNIETVRRLGVLPN